MSSRTVIKNSTGGNYFELRPLTPVTSLSGFRSSVDEYTGYLHNEALKSQKDHIAVTWLLYEKSTNTMSAYMSLIADAIKLSGTEKELHNLDYPFKTVPAMKIAKLAVAQSFQEKYSGVGSFMITLAIAFAHACNDHYFACRFITVDADIEHNEGVLNFYQKNGFLQNAELFNKNRKTISMRKDIYGK
jgi:hypothetical protein